MQWENLNVKSRHIVFFCLYANDACYRTFPPWKMLLYFYYQPVKLASHVLLDNLGLSFA